MFESTRSSPLSPKVARAADWNPKLAEDVFLLYRCSGCHIAPIRPNKWLRFAKVEHATENGQTTEHGHWRCAAKYEKACLQKFTDGGTGRVIVLTDPACMHNGKHYEILFLGNPANKYQLMLDLLKTARLLDTTNFSTVKEHLMEAIEALGKEAEDKLTCYAECRHIRACCQSDVDARVIKATMPYCEDRRLSIKNGGEIFMALHIPPDTKAISEAQLDTLIASIVCCYDLSSIPPPKQPPSKQALKQLQYMQKERNDTPQG